MERRKLKDNTKPIKAPPTLNLSGIVMVSKSIAITTTKNETKITPHTKNDQSLTLSRRKNNNPKNKDVKISTKIYRIGIENLQHLATPSKVSRYNRYIISPPYRFFTGGAC